MKPVVYTEQVLLQVSESIQQLVEQHYFGDEDYAVDYVRQIFRYFSLNLQNLVAYDAPESFNRYSVDGTKLKYVKYCKSSQLTWYAFYEDLQSVNSIVYLANNRQIGHKLEL